MRLQPERAGVHDGIDTGFLPPRSLIATAVDLAVVTAAQRHCELVADLAAERAELREAQVVGVAGVPVADQAQRFGSFAEITRRAAI